MGEEQAGKGPVRETVEEEWEAVVKPSLRPREVQFASNSLSCLGPQSLCPLLLSSCQAPPEPL